MTDTIEALRAELTATQQTAADAVRLLIDCRSEIGSLGGYLSPATSTGQALKILCNAIDSFMAEIASSAPASV